MQNLITPRLMALQKEAMLDKKDPIKKENAEVRVRTYRAMSAAFKQLLVDNRSNEGASDVLSSEEEMSILVKMVKQRKDSASQFKSAKREDLADIEIAEIAVIEDLLPKALTEEEINEGVEKAFEGIEDLNMSKMGQIMGKLQWMKGRTDFGKLSGIIRSRIHSEMTK